MEQQEVEALGGRRYLLLSRYKHHKILATYKIQSRAKLEQLEQHSQRIVEICIARLPVINRSHTHH